MRVYRIFSGFLTDLWMQNMFRHYFAFFRDFFGIPRIFHPDPRDSGISQISGISGSGSRKNSIPKPPLLQPNRLSERTRQFLARPQAALEPFSILCFKYVFSLIGYFHSFFKIAPDVPTDIVYKYRAYYEFKYPL